MIKNISILSMILFISSFAFSQEEPMSIDGNYRDFFISMNIEQCKEALSQDGYFIYSSEEVPSLMKSSEEVLLDCAGRTYIKRGWFQFNDEKLVVMTFILNPEMIDYYSIYKSLTEKYGNPDQLNPQGALWINEENGIEMELSKPLEIKYRDGEFFSQLLENSRSEASMEEILRERFLEDF